MNNDIQLTVTGNVTSAPELRFTPSGAAVVSFRVAVTPRVKRNDQWTDGETTFLGCVAWRELAENIAETIDQGARVVVTGLLRTERWIGSGDGEKHEALRLQVDDIGPSLRYATARVSRVNRSGGQQPQRSSEPPADDPFATASQTAQAQAVNRVRQAMGGQVVQDEPPF